MRFPEPKTSPGLDGHTVADARSPFHFSPTHGCSDGAPARGESRLRAGFGRTGHPVRRRWSNLLVAAVLALAVLAAPATGFAATQSSDMVDGVAASKRGLSPSVLPDVTMRAGALVDGDGRVLWARRQNDRRAMASITKIMTAVVAMENAELTSTVTIPKASGQVGESTAFLRPGEKLPMDQVLEALLVKSGNDAAVAIARSVAGSDEAFVGLMNQKAVELGLKNTHFANTHGLDAPGHYTTAADLAVLGRYAMTKPRFREIVKMKSVTIGSGSRKETLQSTDLLIGNYAGAIGIKTGYTDAAGYSVLSAAQRGRSDAVCGRVGDLVGVAAVQRGARTPGLGIRSLPRSEAQRRGNGGRRGSGD